MTTAPDTHEETKTMRTKIRRRIWNARADIGWTLRDVGERLTNAGARICPEVPSNDYLIDVAYCRGKAESARTAARHVQRDVDRELLVTALTFMSDQRERDLRRAESA